jgi:hypothetical protein
MYVRKKLFQIYYQCLKYSFEKTKIQNTILCLFKPMQAILQRDIYKMIYTKEGMYYQQGVWKWISKYYFIKYYPW